MRVDDRPFSGTTATHRGGKPVCPGDVAGQTAFIGDKIEASPPGARRQLEDAVRMRVHPKRFDDWEAAPRARGCVVNAIHPANTLIVAGDLVGEHLGEIEAEVV